MFSVCVHVLAERDRFIIVLIIRYFLNKSDWENIYWENILLNNPPKSLHKGL